MRYPMFGGIMGKTVTSGGGGSLPPLVINVAADFPTVVAADTNVGRHYYIGSPVTDNDPTKTNTGQTFIAGQDLIWNPSTSLYLVMGNDALWAQGATDVQLVTAAHLNLQNKGLKDANVTTAILIGDASNPSLNTVNKTFAGGINETFASIPLPLYEPFTASAGQLIFDITVGAPTTPASSQLAVQGQLREYGVDYTISGTTITWSNVNYTMQLNDLVQFWGDRVTGASPLGPTTIYRHIQDVNATLGNGRYRQIGGTASYRLSFIIPNDFVSWAANGCKLQGVPAAGAAGSGKDIDNNGEYGPVIGGAYNNTPFTDVSTVYDFTGLANQNSNILTLTTSLAGVSAGDKVNIFVDHNNIGSGGIYYSNFALHYNR